MLIWLGLELIEMRRRMLEKVTQRRHRVDKVFVVDEWEEEEVEKDGVELMMYGGLSYVNVGDGRKRVHEVEWAARGRLEKGGAGGWVFGEYKVWIEMK